MAVSQKPDLKVFFNRLVDRPLEPTDPYYVDFLERGKQEDPISSLATRIGFSEAASVNLLSGQRGSGKSTELRRLRKLLQDDGCVVFLCDMRDYMNLTTAVEISDFFISVMGALSDEVKDKYHDDLVSESYWQRLYAFLSSDVQIDGLKIGAEVLGAKAEVSASLKNDPTFRRQLQHGLRGHVARLVRDAHTFAGEVVDYVRKASGDANKKVVLLVDSVEQIRGVGSDAENVYKSVENLFSGHAESLSVPKLHIVYTIPPYLTPLSPNLCRNFGGGVLCNLPSVHVRSRDGSFDKIGLDVMAEMVAKRFADWQQVFARTQLDRLALDAGGDIRDFFRLLKDCIVRASAARSLALPVLDTILDSAENQLRGEMLPLSAEDSRWLKKIAASKSPELETIKELPHLARFFDTHVVMNYFNGQDWYDVHPLLLGAIQG